MQADHVAEPVGDLVVGEVAAARVHQRAEERHLQRGHHARVGVGADRRRDAAVDLGADAVADPAHRGVVAAEQRRGAGGRDLGLVGDHQRQAAQRLLDARCSRLSLTSVKYGTWRIRSR